MFLSFRERIDKGDEKEDEKEGEQEALGRWIVDKHDLAGL